MNKNVAELIRQIVGDAAQNSCVATVDAVNGRTCDVTPLDGAPIKEVRLNTVVGQQMGIVITPVVGSTVLVTSLSQLDAFVSMYSEIEKIEIVMGSHVIVVDPQSFNIDLDGQTISMAGEGLAVSLKDGKFTFENNSYSIKDGLNDLIDAITKITVPTGTGPSGTPVNATDFVKIKQYLTKLMK